MKPKRSIPTDKCSPHPSSRDCLVTTNGGHHRKQIPTKCTLTGPSPNEYNPKIIPTPRVQGALQKRGQKRVSEPEEQGTCCETVPSSNIRSYTHNSDTLPPTRPDLLQQDHAHSNEATPTPTRPHPLQQDHTHSNKTTPIPTKTTPTPTRPHLLIVPLSGTKY